MADESKDGALEIKTRWDLQRWLEAMLTAEGRWVAVAIAERTALRIVPLVAPTGPLGSDEEGKRSFQLLTFALFFAVTMARLGCKYPSRAEEFRARATNAADAVAKIADANPNSYTSAVAYAAIDAARAVAASDIYGAAANRAMSAAHRATQVAANDTRDVWTAISSDANFISSGGTAQALSSLPLWPNGVPGWVTDNWRQLQLCLRDEGDWQVWLDWYRLRDEGVSQPEEIETIFGSVPERLRAAGPAAANRWIKERLEELEKNPSPPPEIPRQGPGPHVEIDAETGAVVPVKPESLDAEGNNISRLNAQHPQIVRHAGELLANLGQNEQPELYAAAKSYFDNINRNLNQIDFERLLGRGRLSRRGGSRRRAPHQGRDAGAVERRRARGA